MFSCPSSYTRWFTVTAMRMMSDRLAVYAGELDQIHDDPLSHGVLVDGQAEDGELRFPVAHLVSERRALGLVVVLVGEDLYLAVRNAQAINRVRHILPVAKVIGAAVVIDAKAVREGVGYALRKSIIGDGARSIISISDEHFPDHSTHPRPMATETPEVRGRLCLCALRRSGSDIPDSDGSVDQRQNRAGPQSAWPTV